MINTGSFDALVKQVGQTGGDAASLELTELVLTETSQIFLPGASAARLFFIPVPSLFQFRLCASAPFPGRKICLHRSQSSKNIPTF